MTYEVNKKCYEISLQALPPSMAAMMNNPESVEAVMAGGGKKKRIVLHDVNYLFACLGFSGVRRPPPRSAALEHMLHVAGMVDDDAMMELAIQLSLQEQVKKGDVRRQQFDVPTHYTH